MITKVMLGLTEADALLVREALDRYHPIDLEDRQRREQIITTIDTFTAEENQL